MKYFKITEFEKAGIEKITPEIKRNIENLVDKFLDPIREYWGGPVYLLEASGCGIRVTFTTKKREGNVNCLKYLTSSLRGWDEVKVNGDYDSITLSVFPENEERLYTSDEATYLSDWLCCLDSGHGKDVAGKRSPDGTLLEWEWAREIKQRLQKKLESAGVCPCFDVNPEDTEPGLTTRATRANKAWQENNRKGIFVSIHINAAGNGTWGNARGWSVWVAETASSNSKELAKDLYEEAEKAGLKGNRSVPKEKYWTSNFTVLTKTSMPAVLCENLFMDNREDVEYLKSEKGKETILEVLFNGIKTFLKFKQ